MSRPATVAVTGAGGRLGSALVAALGAREATHVLAWHRADLDLDVPGAAEALVARDRPDLVVHCAAWTDVDGCARAPDRALRRNGRAAGELARACVAGGASMVYVSTNEVFDGERTDGRGYTEDDPVHPRNAYGWSKLAGEEAARSAFATTDPDGPRLWVVRVAWLLGPPGGDFADKVVAAADRLPAGQPLPVVSDELGSPTVTLDLAPAMVALIEGTDGGTWHLANAGIASRMDIARRVLARRRPGRAVTPVSRTAYARASDPPAWSVLDTHRASAAGIVLPTWEDALERYLARSAA